jgi:Tfp pilus assembly protein PilX
MLNPRAKANGPLRQRGASSLFITVILVLVVMLLAVTAAVLSSTQFKLAGNLQYENIAFNLADGALASAESWLTTQDAVGKYPNAKDAKFTTYTANSYLYPINYLSTNSIDPLTMTWTDSNSRNLDGAGAQRYLIEKYGADNQPLGTGLDTGGRPLTVCQKVDLFRVTTRGTSAKGTTKFVQTTYSVPSC